MKPSTERSYAQRIARVVEAIVAAPGAPHTVESLAAVAHLSPYHFHRIYRALTGRALPPRCSACGSREPRIA